MGKLMEAEKEIDYTGLVMDDMYEILTTHKNPWPARYTRLKKLEFLDKMLSYLKERELYEKCNGIDKMKEKIKNERVSESIIWWTMIVVRVHRTQIACHCTCSISD